MTCILGGWNSCINMEFYKASETNMHYDISPSSCIMQLDYFHPSLVGHQHMAKGLWNSMLTPATNKTTYLNATSKRYSAFPE